MKRVMLFALVVATAVIGGGARAQEITLESAAPVVVRTTPEAGASDIDPATTEIRVTFSKEMQDGTWSWSMESKESFPETAGKPSYADGRRTCVLPVKLQSGRTYAIWINTPKFRNFKDAKGQPAIPYLLVFRTNG